MKKHLRINVTNYCSMECSTCPISCEKRNHSYLSFSAFQNIIDSNKEFDLHVVLEGGEPLAHKGTFLFLEYLATLKNVQKVTLYTNGAFLPEHGDYLKALVKRTRLPFELKMKITSELVEKNTKHMGIAKAYFEDSKKYGDFAVSFEVRYANDEDYNALSALVDKYGIPRSRCEFDVFRAIGRLANSEYPKPLSGTSLKLWECFASDGTNFGQSLGARAQYEESLGISGIVLIPVFDAVNHKKMWMETFNYVSGITYENRNDFCVDIFGMQKAFIERHLNPYTHSMLHDKIYNYAVYYATRFNQSEWEAKDPFVPEKIHDWCAEKKCAEFFLTVQNMIKTTDIERFYEYKNISLRLADSIANLAVRSDIKFTLDNCQHCC